MELIQIGADALKVTLTREDMQYYDIAFERLDYENSETRRAIHEILCEAKRSLGFDMAREKLYIQAFADSGGGCELFVRASGPEEKPAVLPKLCRFSSVRLLLCACAALTRTGFSGESRAYFGDDGCYYLALGAKELPLFLTELGEALPYGAAFLCEHTALVSDRAVEQLGKLA